jgi:hypothetical protein
MTMTRIFLTMVFLIVWRLDLSLLLAMASLIACLDTLAFRAASAMVKNRSVAMGVL